MVPLTAVEADRKVPVGKVNTEIVGGCQMEEKRLLRCVCIFVNLHVNTRCGDDVDDKRSATLNRNKCKIMKWYNGVVILSPVIH